MSADYSIHFNLPPSVEECVAIPPDLLNALQAFAGFRRDASQFSHSPDGILNYVYTLRSFAEAVLRCLPRTSFEFSELPVGRADFLEPYVVEFIVQLVRIFLFLGFGSSVWRYILTFPQIAVAHP